MKRRTLLATTATVAIAGCLSADDDAVSDDDNDNDGDEYPRDLDVRGTVADDLSDGDVTVVSHNAIATGYDSQPVGIEATLRNDAEEARRVRMSVNIEDADGNVIDDTSDSVGDVRPDQEANLEALSTADVDDVSAYQITATSN